jgi:hypothetical protein
MAPVADEAFIGPGIERHGIESGPPPAAPAESEVAEVGEPIRLFDRKKTRELRASEQSDAAHAQNGSSNGKLPDVEGSVLLEESSHGDNSVTEPVSQNGAVEEHWGDSAETDSEVEQASERA